MCIRDADIRRFRERAGVEAVLVARFGQWQIDERKARLCGHCVFWGGVEGYEACNHSLIPLCSDGSDCPYWSGVVDKGEVMEDSRGTKVGREGFHLSGITEVGK